MPLNIVYMGTPEFAVPPLRALAGAGHRLLAAVSQPDRPQGRGMRVRPPAVKTAAEALGIPVLQPNKLREAANELRTLAPDLIVVAAYGKILPRALLELPPLGAVNIHASLLPRFRGAAPIQRAVAEGESESGVTTMYMAEGLDEGDMIYREATAIGPEDTGGTLHDRLMAIGARLIVKTVAAIENGSAPRTPQEHAQATYAPSIGKEEARVDWARPAREIVNLVRGFNPLPVAFTALGGAPLKLYAAEVDQTVENAEPGTVLRADDDGLLVASGEGAVRVVELQAAGKRRMRAGDYLRGHAVAAGAKLG